MRSQKPGARNQNRNARPHFWLLAPGFWLLLIGFWLLPAYAQTYTLDQVLAKMEENGKKFQSMQASLERTKVTVIVNDKATDSGTVYFKRRGKDPRIMVDITKPEQQRMLVDQGKALLYFPKLKQVQEYFLGQNQDKAEFLLIGFGQSNQDIRKVYDTALVGEETINGVKTSILELKPKSAKVSALFNKIRLWMDQTKWIPIQSQLTEGSGDYMIVKFTNIKMNVKIPESAFDLKMPKDVKTIKL
jgi:outer membrane lipoprotein-sorting protein